MTLRPPTSSRVLAARAFDGALSAFLLVYGSAVMHLDRAAERRARADLRPWVNVLAQTANDLCEPWYLAKGIADELDRVGSRLVADALRRSYSPIPQLCRFAATPTLFRDLSPIHRRRVEMLRAACRDDRAAVMREVADHLALTSTLSSGILHRLAEGGEEEAARALRILPPAALPMLPPHLRMSVQALADRDSRWRLNGEVEGVVGELGLKKMTEGQVDRLLSLRPDLFFRLVISNYAGMEAQSAELASRPRRHLSSVPLTT